MSAWSLVGRQEEVVLCRSCVSGDTWRGVVVAGAPGVGKTRLASEVCTAVALAGRVVLRATATEAARTIPLGALAHLLPADLGRAPTSYDVLRRAGVSIAERGARDPPLVVVDDAHLLDAASASLVRQLVADGRAVAVMTVRSGESAPDAVTALWKDCDCAYVELQPLSREETRVLAESVLGGSLEGRTEQLLWRSSRGVPLVLRELLLHGLEAGVLERTVDLWRWHGELAIGRRLRELVAARIGVLDRRARDVVERVALGEPLPVSWLPVSEAADALVERGVLDAVRTRRRLELRFAHPLHGEVVRSGIPATRAAAVRRELADALEATGARRSGDLLRLATWCLDTGKPLSGEVFIEAAEQAERSFGPALAERLARAAEAAGGGVRAGVAVARAVSAQGRFGDAERVLAALEDGQLGDGERVVVGEFRARLLAGPLERRDEALAELAAARLAVRDSAARASLAVAEAFMSFRFGDPRHAVVSVAGVIDDPAVDARRRTAAAAAAVHMLAQIGRPVSGLALAEKWRPATQATGVPSAVRAEAEFAETIALLISGRLADAKARALAHYAAVLETEQIEMLGRAAWCRGAVSLCQGAVETARTYLRESVEVLGEVDARGLYPWALSLLSQAAGHTGDAAEAAEALRAAEAAAPKGEWNFTASLESARAWTSAAEGALSEARRWALASGTRGRERGQLSTAFLNLHDVVRFGAPEHAVEPLIEIAREIEGDWARACADHGVALAERDPLALREVSDSFEDIGALLFAAEASAEAATVYCDRGRESSARSSAARVRVLLSQCPGARTPALALEPVREGLTGRQREIAALAARGSSNKEIAARLVLSVRTVENQLQQAYRKLGITSRSELRSVLEVE